MVTKYSASKPEDLAGLPAGTKELHLDLLLPIADGSFFPSTLIPETFDRVGEPEHIRGVDLDTLGKAWRHELALIPVPVLSNLDWVEFSVTLPQSTDRSDPGMPEIHFDTTTSAYASKSHTTYIMRSDDLEHLVIAMATQIKMRSVEPLILDVLQEAQRESLRPDVLARLKGRLGTLSVYQRPVALKQDEETSIGP